jgi:hypothetical protein
MADVRPSHVFMRPACTWYLQGRTKQDMRTHVRPMGARARDVREPKSCARDSSGVDLGLSDALKSRAHDLGSCKPIALAQAHIEGRWAPMSFGAPMGMPVPGAQVFSSRRAGCHVRDAMCWTHIRLCIPHVGPQTPCANQAWSRRRRRRGGGRERTRPKQERS